MPWCPVCKNEYKEGYTHCNDCDVDLVASLESGPAAVIFGEKEAMEEMQELLLSGGIEDTFIHADEKGKMYELYVPHACMEDAKNMINAHLLERAQAQNVDEEQQADMPDEECGMSTSVYVDKTQKAEEYKSSAAALIVVGAVGIVVLVLLMLDVLQFHMYGMSKVITGVVMGALFVIFFVMGISSLRLYKRYLVLAQEENGLIGEMKQFLAQQAQMQDIQKQIPDLSQLDEMQKYYEATGIVKRLLTDAFPQAEQALVEKLTDDWYTESDEPSGE